MHDGGQLSGGFTAAGHPVGGFTDIAIVEVRGVSNLDRPPVLDAAPVQKPAAPGRSSALSACWGCQK